jgi:hypothetical protein
MPAAHAPRRITTLLAAALACASFAATPDAEAREQMPFVCAWDCGVALFTFTNETYNPGGDDPLPILAVERQGDDFTLDLPDDYRIVLSGVTETRMGWFSEASGDGFECVRVWW